MCALQFQHREDAHVIIPLQRRVVRDQHWQTAGEMVIARREGIGPALLPTLLEAVEFFGKIRTPAHHICQDFWRIIGVPVAQDKFNFATASCRQQHVPLPVNNAIVIRYGVGLCRGTNGGYEARPLVRIERGYSISLQTSWNRKREFNICFGRARIGDFNADEDGSLLVDHSRVRLHD